MRVLLTETAFDRFGSLLAAIEAVRMQAHGSLRDANGEVGRDDAAVEVAWATADLFDADAPIRPFFRLALRPDTLRWFQSAAAGTDDAVFARLLARGVWLTTSHVTDLPIAEYVLRAVLDHYQDPARWAAARADRRWAPHDFREVAGTRWLVIGVGAIGAAVAVRARAFGATVTGVRRHPRGDEPVDAVVRPDQVVDAVGDADVVVVAAPATDDTHPLVHAQVLRSMAPGSVLVNVSRGALVYEGALIEALDRGVPEVAVLDVASTEPPPPDSPLWGHPRVVLTPHSSALGHGRHARAAEVFADNLAAYRAGETLAHEVTTAS